MKKAILITALIFACCILPAAYSFSQGTAINDNGASPDGSAMLDVSSTSKGMLIPRMTTAQRNGISSPAKSLMIFNTDMNCFQIYNSNQVVWENIYCFLGCVAAPSTPGAVSGNATPCLNATGEVYSVAAVSGATTYTWTVPSGATLISGQGSTSITVNFGTSGGDISVTAGNNCGTSAPQTLAVTMSTVPGAPGSITGTQSPCQNAAGVSYSISAVSGATTYNWTVPAGATVASGQGDTAITVNFGTSDGDVSVTAGNACGNSSASTLAITLNSVPGAPAEGTHTPSQTQIVWNWNTVSGASGYKWYTTNDFNNATDMGVLTSNTEMGLTCGTSYTRYVWAYNVCGPSSATTLTQSTSSCCSDGTGGTITHVSGKTIHTFISSGTFTPGCSGNVEVLVVAGGGGGGGNVSDPGNGGGGGAGGLVYSASYAVTVQGYSVTVGNGGNGGGGTGQSGGNSVFGTITAYGGGGGGTYGTPGDAGSGGSGGGAGQGGGSCGGPGSASPPGQGNNGGNKNFWTTGGGGGAGAVGADANGTRAGDGGVGLQYSISGAATYYAGGGGGSSHNSCSGNCIAQGGSGGGGNGHFNANPPGAGTANSGGGGGGAGEGVNGAAGGSGVVIISYTTP